MGPHTGSYQTLDWILSRLSRKLVFSPTSQSLVVVCLGPRCGPCVRAMRLVLKMRRRIHGTVEVSEVYTSVRWQAGNSRLH